MPGTLYAVTTVLAWGTYFIPIKMSDASLWIATFPLAIGILFGSTVLMLLGR
jgi:glucose uptake protein